MNAMILAAGLGTRLRPYSLKRPKPLFPILDTPLLARIIEQLLRIGCERIVVNAHHLSSQITSFLEVYPQILVQVEPEILGTGGGPRQALPLFGTEPLLLVNGDIFHTINLAQVVAAHLAGKGCATLVVHDVERFNLVPVAGDGRILGFSPGEIKDVKTAYRPLAFTGIQVLQPEILKRVPLGQFYSILDVYRGCIAAGERVQALEVQGHYWTDIGTPTDYLDLHGRIMEGGLHIPGQAEAMRPFYVGKNARVARSAKFTDWVVVGQGAEIQKGAVLRRTVVWDGAVVPANQIVEDSIII